MTGIVAFVIYSVLTIAPVLFVVFSVSRLRHPTRLVGVALLAVVVGFFVGGTVGWAAVPGEWTASLATTIYASGDAATYGEAFEHQAERVLMWFFVSALLGEVALGALALLVLRRLPLAPPLKTQSR